MTMPITEAPAPTAFVPEQARPTDHPVANPVVNRAADRVPTVVDHVRVHGVRCYWDLRECRWECRPD